jgi:hypothetical protein
VTTETSRSTQTRIAPARPRRPAIPKAPEETRDAAFVFVAIAVPDDVLVMLVPDSVIVVDPVMVALRSNQEDIMEQSEKISRHSSRHGRGTHRFRNSRIEASCNTNIHKLLSELEIITVNLRII